MTGDKIDNAAEDSAAGVHSHDCAWRSDEPCTCGQGEAARLASVATARRLERERLIGDSGLVPEDGRCHMYCDECGTSARQGSSNRNCVIESCPGWVRELAPGSAIDRPDWQARAEKAEALVHERDGELVGFYAGIPDEIQNRHGLLLRADVAESALTAARTNAARVTTAAKKWTALSLDTKSTGVEIGLAAAELREAVAGLGS